MAIFGNGEIFHLKTTLKYVNDYSSELYEDENGKTRERHTYIGPLIKFMDEEGYVKKRFYCVRVFSLLTVALILFNMFLNHATAWWAFVVIPLFISAFPGLYLFMGAAALPFKIVPMKRDHYMHSIIRIYRSAASVAVFETVALIAEFIYRISKNDWLFLKDDIIFLISLVFVIALSILTIVVLRSVNIDELEITTKS